MSENVVALPGANPAGTVNEDLVKLLEGLVDRAKSGEIVGLAYAASNGDRLGKRGPHLAFVQFDRYPQRSIPAYADAAGLAS